MPALPPVTLIGHPFGSTGRAQHLRAVWRALATTGITARIVDMTAAPASDDPELFAEFGPHLTGHPPDGFRLFHLNGDEIGPQRAAAAARRGRRARRELQHRVSGLGIAALSGRMGR